MKTPWSKNNDSRYISGEDLQFGLELNKGLKPEMVVKISTFKDSETFDQNAQEKIIKTGLTLIDIETGNELYKPLILNNINGDFLEKEFGSIYLEDWIGKEFVLYAKADKRHVFVARCKKYYPKVKPTFTQAQFENAKKAGATVEKIKEIYTLTDDIQTKYEEYVKG